MIANDMIHRPRTARPVFGRLLTVFLALSRLFTLPAGPAAAADDLDHRGRGELGFYLFLARASELAYDDSRPDLESTPSGCVALVREDAGGNLVIAFRGSMLGDRDPKHPFSNLGGAVVRRNYRDWVATNLKQTAGFLPRQYTEAASLVEKHLLSHPVDKYVLVTGHSKGGGAAAYAFVAASLSPRASPERVRRMRCVTFNAVVVRERNWRRLFRGLPAGIDGREREPPPGSIRALFMVDDPVSRIAEAEERRYVERIGIVPSNELSPNEQHGIRVIIEELERRLAVSGRR